YLESRPGRAADPILTSRSQTSHRKTHSSTSRNHGSTSRDQSSTWRDSGVTAA
ncbi:hypothetical protein M2316_004093, partial [Cellulosimicrobium cellulans]|nr:hypothetical protein [Cellulosimicrobium cellulans]